MIEFKNVNFSYGNKNIINDLSFVLNDGEILVIVGKNATGKTTILKLIAKILKQNSGEILVNGDVGYVPQGVALFYDMTVKENLDFFYSLRHKKLPSELPFGLSKYKNKKISTLSGGIKKITSIATALSDMPQIILYDEPYANLDVLYVEEIKSLIKMQKSIGKTIVCVTHLYEDFCDNYDKLLFVDDKKYIMFNKENFNKEKYLSLFRRSDIC